MCLITQKFLTFFSYWESTQIKIVYVRFLFGQPLEEKLFSHLLFLLE